MRSPATKLKRRIAIAALLLLALALALPMPASANGDHVFASIRLYDGIDPADMDEISRLAQEVFLPAITASDGFIGYYWLRSGERLATINLFTSAEEASASNDAARESVAEHFAPLLPNPPMLVQGKVHIGLVDMLEVMEAAALDRLHASLRVYEDFAPDDLDAYVQTVREGFLPLMTESPGFFGYYMLTNDSGTLAALSIFDSPASALASNEHAREFVAERLAAYLPSAPTITSGEIGIAMLAHVHDGANLVADRLHTSVRIYQGIDPAVSEQLAQIVADGFLPIMRDSAGFVGYYLLLNDETLTAISLFESPEQAEASNEAAREFVAENMADLLPEAPTIYSGPLGLEVEPALQADGMAPETNALYASLRVYADYDLTHFDEANALAEIHLVPQFLGIDGFFAQYTMHDNDSHVVAISLYESEEAAAAANASARAFSQEYLSQWSPNPPTGFNANVAVAALADLGMGENLIGAMMAGS